MSARRGWRTHPSHRSCRRGRQRCRSSGAASTSFPLTHVCCTPTLSLSLSLLSTFLPLLSPLFSRCSLVVLEDNSLVVLEINDTATGLHPAHVAEDCARIRALVLRRMQQSSASRAAAAVP